MTTPQPIMGYLATTGYQNDTAEEYASKNAQSPPFLMSIRGPTRKMRSKFDTITPGSDSGQSGPLNLLQQRIWAIDTSLAWNSIGRARGQHIQVYNDAVSKTHASILRDITTGNWAIRPDAKENLTALVHYQSPLLEEDLGTERRHILNPGELYTLENKVVIELARTDCCTRLAFFTDYGDLITWYHAQLKKPDAA